MPELRHNLITREWVIIATDRAKRPSDFSNHQDRMAAPSHVSSCPFCPGNESKTPEELHRISIDGMWKMRVVANKYPAVDRDGAKTRSIDGTERFVSGVGLHDIIIESPLHNTTLALMEPEDIVTALGLYKERFIEAYKDSRVEHVIIFKNHGLGAGTSIDHPHAQLVAIPIVPVQHRDRVNTAMQYFDDTGVCLMCDTLNREIKDAKRIVTETEHFLTFIPYAALSPFHSWIFPKRHSASFSDITDDEIEDLGFHLKNLLSRFYYGLEDPDFNLVIRSSRPKDIGNEFTHWYMSVMPKMTQTAGFELGSGMYINQSLPEENAEFLKGVRIG